MIAIIIYNTYWLFACLARSKPEENQKSGPPNLFGLRQLTLGAGAIPFWDTRWSLYKANGQDLTFTDTPPVNPCTVSY